MAFKTANTQAQPNILFFSHRTKKRQRNPTHKARVMQATQADTQPKLALHMLSAYPPVHYNCIRNIIQHFRINIFCIFTNNS